MLRLRFHLLLALAFATAAVCVALASAAGGPPVIKEGFTPLPCPAHPSTTLALEGCAEKAVLKTDAAINAKVKSIYNKLSSSGRASFVSGEKSWLRYRRASCLAQSSKYAGGTFGPVAFAQCEASRNKTHLTDLTLLAKALRP